jgi:nucleoside-diphosphate-sugar epimerase
LQDTAEFVQDPKDDTPSARFLTVALTGGTGFIGRAVIRRLLQERVRIRALVRPASISSCFEAQGLSWIQGQLGNDESLRQLLDGASVVIHCAGSVRGASEADFVPANVSAVEKIVQVVRDSADPRRFLLISSLAARTPELSPYAASKRLGEEVLRGAARGIDWTILRPPAVYGPGDRELLPLLQWMQRGLLFVPGGGNGRFSMIFIADLTEAILTWLKSGAGAGGCFELHDGKKGGYSWEEIRETAADLYQRAVHRIDIPQGLLETAAQLNAAFARLIGYRPMLTPGKVRELCHDNWVCDNADFSSATGWQPGVELREGLLRTLG